MVRFKNRYIVLEITPKFGKEDKQFMLKNTILAEAVQGKVQELYGDFGIAAIKDGFNAKYCNAHTRIAVIRTRHGPHKFLLRAVPLINDMAGRLVRTSILYVGGTLKHCFVFIRKHQEKKLEQMWCSLQTEPKRMEMMTALFTVLPSMKSFK